MSADFRTLEFVPEQRRIVDYALARRSVLDQVRRGELELKDVQDAGHYLLSAAEFHGVPIPRACPLCRHEPLEHVAWVYGDSLGHASGSARKPNELDRLADSHTEFTVHIVEVCRGCRWNYLVQSFTTGKIAVPKRPRSGQRTAAAKQVEAE